MAEPADAIAQITTAWKQMAVALVPAMQQLGKAMREAGVAIDDVLWRAYEEAGTPYGPNYAGRDRWVRERGEIADLRERADDLEVFHESMAELRRIMRDR